MSRRRKDDAQDHLVFPGIDLEIYERSEIQSGAVIPNIVRINGTEVAIPEDSKISFVAASDDAVRVTMTMFVRSLTIGTE